MRNLQEQVKKAFCNQNLFWPFTVWIHCSIDLKIFANAQPAALNFKSCSQSLEHFFLKEGQNNFGNKIPYCGAIFSRILLWKILSGNKNLLKTFKKNCYMVCWLDFYYEMVQTSFLKVRYKREIEHIGILDCLRKWYLLHKCDCNVDGKI